MFHQTENLGSTGHLKFFWPILNNSEYTLLHCGTKDLSQDISAVDIRKKILEVAVSCESDTNILVSGNVNDK